jgi:pimeloyl-ACP methyl ester carboxylesterase
MIEETEGASTAPGLGFTRTVDVLDELAQITALTLIVRGDQDFVCPPSAAAQLVQGVAGGQIVIVENCGHVPYVEQPEAFRSAVEGFLGG